MPSLHLVFPLSFFLSLLPLSLTSQMTFSGAGHSVGLSTNTDTVFSGKPNEDELRPGMFLVGCSLRFVVGDDGEMVLSTPFQMPKKKKKTFFHHEKKKMATSRVAEFLIFN